MQPAEVIAEVRKARLRGRGGAGFPTALKWELCARARGNRKYLICNADEGDPGAFMDRAVLESDPHSVLEGMVIAAYAIGAGTGYIYVRAEYPLALERLKAGIDAMRENGLLGENILGSGFAFDIVIKEGAGAFVCGEETALIASIEGRRGMPSQRPPFPATSGLFGKPTNINNVETFANVSAICAMGSDWFSQHGTSASRGTKTFALAGKVERTGLVEVPLGTTLREIIFDIGGGIPNGKRIKAVQTGGPSGGCIPATLMDTPVDYEKLAEVGAIMGSGGMVVMDEDTCMVDIARYFIAFTKEESCGKCTPCRVGTAEMLHILNKICAGKGEITDLDMLGEIAAGVKDTALCGLGQSAPNPVLTTLKFFRAEYEEHIEQHKCKAAVCKEIVGAPCTHTCPANIDVPRYIRYIGQGRYRDALNVIREKIPFPFVCGRVCFHPCEAKCRRGQIDEPIAIRALKRVASDRGGHVKPSAAPAQNGKRIAIIGSGPSGLTAGYYLRNLGYDVTVHEAMAEPGGMMRSAIPDYRMPPRVLQKEIDSLGLKIRCRSRIESIEKLRESHDAVIVATGAHIGTRLNIPGEELPGVMDCVDFLRKANSGKSVKVGKTVLVIGGGNAAIDAARAALRQGAREVIIAYRRAREQMPATAEEVHEAKKERVKFRFLAAPRRIEKRKGRLEMSFVQMRLGPVDRSGRPSPVPVEGSRVTIVADTVLCAIGQRASAPQTTLPIIDKWGRIAVNPKTCMTEVDGVFAGGDVVRGPSSVIECIAQGRSIAQAIDRYFGGSGNIDEKLAPEEDRESLTLQEPSETAHRVHIPTVAVKGRSPKREVERCLSSAAARKEARRCLNCDLEE
jgi:NADH-quinone oxidoreductase subunit F